MKILACTDGSELSYKALKEAAIIAEGLEKAEVTVIYVEEYISHRGDLGQYFSEDSYKQLKERIEADRARIAAKAGEIFEEANVEFTLLIKEGHPAQTIIDLVSEKGFDLVVLGSRGQGGLDKLFLGSVSNAVAQEAKASVMIVRG